VINKDERKSEWIISNSIIKEKYQEHRGLAVGMPKVEELIEMYHNSKSLGRFIASFR